MAGGRFLPVAKAEKELGKALRCTCEPWPCTEATCQRCPACEKHGHALVTRIEERWVETGKGLTDAEVKALRSLWGNHANHNSRLLRQGDAPYGTGRDPLETVADACAQ